jgi:hypothetical protein
MNAQYAAINSRQPYCPATWPPCLSGTKRPEADALLKCPLSVVKPVGHVLNAKTYNQQNNNNDVLPLKQGWTKCGTADDEGV